MNPVDMDRIATWPPDIIAFLNAHSKELRIEREADREYALAPSDFRIMNTAPPMPRWNEAKVLIATAMADREVVAFHATRLVDINDVYRDGLLRLNLVLQVARLKKQLEVSGAYDELSEVDGALAQAIEADSVFIKREGAVWASPQRMSLHDGGCKVFYDYYGGEAIKWMARYAKGNLELRLKQIGKPAVVIIRYPAYGWCRFTNSRLPKSMIELYLQYEGSWEAMDYSWDIMIKRDVPAKHVIAVVPPGDLAVAV